MRLLVFLFLLAIGSWIQAQEGNFIETNGVKLYYEIHGEGDTLLLLHGNTQTHDMWTPWIDDLSKDYKVITVDMRGHGQSNNPTNTFSEFEKKTRGEARQHRKDKNITNAAVFLTPNPREI